MRRVLVPLDGTTLAASILPDAQRLAGRDGTLILIHDAGGHSRGNSTGPGVSSMAEATQYLEHLADQLQSRGVRVEAHTLAMIHPAHAIDVAVDLYQADIIACATHGRSPAGRLLRGGVVWNALAHSPVPVLLRNPGGARIRGSIFAQPRRILVPLDGSQYSESAVPLARQLADEWGADVLLAQVIPALPPTRSPFGGMGLGHYGFRPAARKASEYLAGIATTFNARVETTILTGGAIDELAFCAEHAGITDIVLASHGHTGLMRVVLGSVADELVHRLHLPIVVIPSMAAHRAVPVTPGKERRTLRPASQLDPILMR